MWTLPFWRDVAERTISTGAQGLVVLLGGGVGLLGIAWGPALLGVLAMILLTVAKALAAGALTGPTGSEPSASLLAAGRHSRE